MGWDGRCLNAVYCQNYNALIVPRRYCCADNILNVCRRVSEKGKSCTKDNDCCTKPCPFWPGSMSQMVLKSAILLAMNPNEETSNFARSNTPGGFASAFLFVRLLIENDSSLLVIGLGVNRTRT